MARRQERWEPAPSWEVSGEVSVHEWWDVLRSDPEALASQSPAWVEAVCAFSSYVDVSRLYRRGDGSRLVLPIVSPRLMPPSVAPRLSMPEGCSTGGVVAEDGRLSREDLAVVMADLARRPLASVVVRPNPRLGHYWADSAPWTTVRDVRAQILELGGGFGEVWSHRFRSSVRRAVRKAERSRLAVERDSTGALMADFHALYTQSVTRWAGQEGVPPVVARIRAARGESLRKFRTVGVTLGPACTTWMAYLDGEPAAGIIVLTQGGNATYWRGAMNRDLAGPSRANDLLHRLAIEDACERGLERYSLGISNPGSSLERFKTGFGAHHVPYSDYFREGLPLVRTVHQVRRRAYHALQRTDRVLRRARRVR